VIERFPVSASPVNTVLVAAMVCLAPLTARAEGKWSGEVPAKARALAERGRALHDAGDYASAIVAFTQAYAMAPSPALLFNLAQAYRLQGDCDDAALMYRRFLATGPSPDRTALAEAHLVNVERCIHKLSLHIPDETARGIALPPPPIDGSVTSEMPRSRTAAIEKDVGIGLMGGGTFALGLAVYYAVQSHNASTEVADAYAHGARGSDIAPIDQRGRTASRNAAISGGAAAVGVAGGLAMYLIGRHTERSPLVTPTAHGAEVSMSWSF